MSPALGSTSWAPFLQWERRLAIRAAISVQSRDGPCVPPNRDYAARTNIAWSSAPDNTELLTISCSPRQPAIEQVIAFFSDPPRNIAGASFRALNITGRIVVVCVNPALANDIAFTVRVELGVHMDEERQA